MTSTPKPTPHKPVTSSETSPVDPSADTARLQAGSDTVVGKVSVNADPSGTSDATPESEEGRSWELKGLPVAWQKLGAAALAADEHPEVDLLASYASGSLSESQREALEEHLSRCPHCLHATRVAFQTTKKALPVAPSAPAVLTRTANRPRATMHFGRSFALAASVLLGIGAFYFAQRQVQLAQNVTSTTGVAQLDLRDFYAPHSRFADLNGERTRSVVPVLPEPVLPEPNLPADEFALLKRSLQELGIDPSRRREFLLVRAELELLQDHVEEARASLDEARRLPPATLNDRQELLEALTLLAKSGPADPAKAADALRKLTERHTDFVPGWYNLALLRQHQGDTAGSRAAWQSYLQREQRPEFRQLAESYLDRLPKE